MQKITISSSLLKTNELGPDFTLFPASVVLRGSLPYPPLTSFIGRAREVAEIKALLATTRLLTLTGTGGCGKTHLAYEVAANLMEEFEQCVYWVDISTLADPSLILPAVARALLQYPHTDRKKEEAALSPQSATTPEAAYQEKPKWSGDFAPDACEQSGKSTMDTLSDFLRAMKLLLVLDGCEHMVIACAQITEALLYICPGLRILTTSREVLRITGEIAWRVPSLCLPSDHCPPLHEFMLYEAIQLFVERAAAVQPSFLLTEENVSAVFQICQRLNGLPLAIELAVARMTVLSVEQIALRLDDCCQLLTVGSRTALLRQQTLRATIDWSYNLLTRKEQILFHRLSMFVESFTLEEVEAICTGADIEKEEILDQLSHLVDKSLVEVEEHESKIRYRLLEMMRQYSYDKLQAVESVESLERLVDIVRSLTLTVSTTGTEQISPPEEVRLPTVEILPAKEQQELRIFALGQARVYRNRHALTPTDWTYTKARELLFYLLCHRARTKMQIGLALWPDASTSQLRSSFHSTLHHLRRALGRPEWIIFEKDLYTFNHSLSYWFDVKVFESYVTHARKLQVQTPLQAIHYLKKAVKLYQGDFLEDNLTSDWYLLQQKELRKTYLDALFTLGQLHFAAAQYAQANDVYRQLISCDSYLEVVHRELMRCYVRQGERGQALRHYQTLVTMMCDEFGSLPAPETTMLFERLRRGEDC
jgi:predicted ATPase/DNA-binding SARP family transcriptional activator